MGDQIISATTSTTPAAVTSKGVVGGEKAALFLAQHGQVAFEYEEEKKVLRKIDVRVLPLMLGAYFFQQLDKSSLSYSSLFGIIEDAQLGGTEYSWLGSILYVAQLVMQPLAALLLVKLPYGKVMAGAILGWGVCEAMMASCTGFRSLLALRFLLGTFEAVIAPSCLAVTQMWWRRSEQTLRTSYWNAMNGLTFILGSLLTYGLGHVHSDRLYRYQTIFLFCGLLTIAFATLFLCLMPDSPMEAKCLSERERLVAVERLRANQMGVASGTWRWHHVTETLLDAKTWLWFILIVAISVASGGISSFGNLIIKSFGYTNFDAILFSLPSGVVNIVSVVGSAWLATRYSCKGLSIACLAVLPALGAVIMLTVPRQIKGLLLLGYYLVQCLGAITPMIYTWSAQNTAGDTKKKTTSAVVFIGMCTGNIIGPLLYSPDQAPLYRPGLIANLIMFVLVGALGLLIPVYLVVLNRRHATMRQQLGKSAIILDESMTRPAATATTTATAVANDAADDHQAKDGKGAVAVAAADQIEHARPTTCTAQKRLEDDKGLHDVTDLKNEDFIYVY